MVWFISIPFFIVDIFFVLGHNGFFMRCGKQHGAALWVNMQALAVASVWLIAEQLLAVAAASVPWFGYRAGFGLAGSLPAVQPAAFLGAGALSLIVVLCNYLSASILLSRQYRKLWLPATLAAAYLLAGFLILQDYRAGIKESKTFTVALASQNADPALKWDEFNGDMLARGLITLARQATVQNPALILWTESAIPWTYRPNDDLLKEIIKATPGTDRIIGINTDHTANSVFNSAYYLNAGGAVTARYDKQYPLGFIEKPLAGIIFLFLSQEGFRVAPGSGSGILKTACGKAGILICNESSVPALALQRENEGAQFLLNLSNDGWFARTYLADAHFYNARLRAVECRKDVAVCSNDGYCGLVRATGDIALQTRDQVPLVQNVEITANDTKTFYAGHPHLLLILSFLYLSVVRLWMKTRTSRR